MVLGVYGKHPAKGDFLEHGLPAGLRRHLELWLDTVLAEARGDLGAEWEFRWANAPILRFWIGEAIWHQPVAGVMAATQDRVGRRFPLIILSAGEVPAPPALDPVQDWYDRTAAHLDMMLTRTDLEGPAVLVDGLCAPETVQGAAPVDAADFWAVREDADMAALWGDVALTDHRRAAAVRSYWWAPPDVPVAAAPGPADPPGGPVVDPLPAVEFSSRAVCSQVWAGHGLPSGQAIAWFLRGFQQNG